MTNDSVCHGIFILKCFHRFFLERSEKYNLFFPLTNSNLQPNDWGKNEKKSVVFFLLFVERRLNSIVAHRLSLVCFRIQKFRNIWKIIRNFVNKQKKFSSIENFRKIVIVIMEIFYLKTRDEIVIV